MKVSVIIPVYNRKEKIKRAIDSVLKQSIKADEIIVIDDGSNDGTQKVLKGYKNHIKIITQTNKGVSAARNRGIKSAKNSWIALLDSDDWWFEDKLKEQIEFHKQNPNILISQTDEVWIKNSQEIKKAKRFRKKLQGFIFKESLKLCLISPSAVMIHKSVFDDVGIFDETLPACEDYDLWLRITAKYFVGLIERALIAKTGGHEDQLSIKYWGMDRFRIKAMQKHIDNPLFRDDVLKEITDKCQIIINGAKKRKNRKIYQEYTDLLQKMRIQ